MSDPRVWGRLEAGPTTVRPLHRHRIDTMPPDDPLIACVDADYRTRGAVAAALWFRGWAAAATEREAVRSFAAVAEYEPGAFYRRELPCLLGVLALGPRPDVVVVDGYVWLGGGGAPGLGARLQAEVGGVVVGVAKTRFASAAAVEVCRGASRSPLFVTAAGVEAEVAAGWVAAMHGPYRVPTLLKRVDALARTAPQADDPSGACADGRGGL